MGTPETAGKDSSQMVPDKTIAFSHLALILILAIIFPTHASPLEPYKRGRSASSSLIPFPRVGRSVSEPLESNADSDNPNDDPSMLRSTRSSSQFYGQKRTGKSSLIPFPRVGRRSDPSLQKWQNLQRDTSNDRVKRSPFGLLAAAAAEPEFKTLPYPRIGKRFSQNKREPGNMIPMARIGKRFGLSDDAMFEKPRPEMGQMFKRVVWNNLLWNARL